ncbi:hypothetical protein [Shinella zoogloeoides]|uniref:hypothetical protein n=1 Tax=Shinella zoogloeoides TaxID=352475 RepID=UPI0013C33900|nr:hypothetical protein [Shinella zoogloeoides]
MGPFAVSARIEAHSRKRKSKKILPRASIIGKNAAMQVRIMPDDHVVPALIRVEIPASNKPNPAQYHLLKSKNDYESAAWRKMKARNREGIRYNFNQIRFKYSSNQSQILFLFYAYAILI